jgi:hypothetical protein
VIGFLTTKPSNARSYATAILNPCLAGGRLHAQPRLRGFEMRCHGVTSDI